MKIQNTIATLATLAGLGMGASYAAPTVVAVTSDITSDTTWDSDTDDDGDIDKIYYINKVIAVKDSSLTNSEYTGPKAVLTITPGTVIACEGSASASTGTQVGSLVVTRAGQLEAVGTKDAPIIFTSVSAAEARYAVDVNNDGVTNTIEPSPIGDGGEWGGVILLGNAPINYVVGTTNVNQNSIEGFPAGSSQDILYGGTNQDDNSGTLNYVRIEFGGFEYEPDKEINGLTMGGVGSGTDIEFVEVTGNTDDGFEWFGGTVSTQHLISYANQDESFDLDEGHQGTHQFLFAVQSTASDNGTEADGGNGTDTSLAPFNLAKFYNVTYIGGGINSAKTSDNDAFRLKENFAGQFHNSIFHDFGGNTVRVASDTGVQVGLNLLFTNNIFGTFATSGTHNGSAAEAALLAQSGNVVGVDPSFSTLTRTANEVSAIDPRPTVGTLAWTGSLTKGAPAPVNYRGAFGAQNWADGWSYMSGNRGLPGDGVPAATGTSLFADTFIGDTITIVNVTSDITADTTWNSDMDNDGVVDTIYYLNKAIAVKDSSLTTAEYTGSKVTLTIEPGTIIASEGSGTAGSGTQVGSLVVTRAGKLNAVGTMEEPIIFTSVSAAEARFAVDVNGDTFINDLEPSPIADGGEWGGVILLGNAPINYVAETTNVNQAAIEGFPAATSADILYGGNNVNDDSGALKYVRIEFGGFEFQPDEEINGLTMGGVGSATDISFVEVVGNTDDGFEFFGGTVNTSYLISYANQDESFDIDEGHSGIHQFWFALQSTASDNGTEGDGGNGDSFSLQPFTVTKVYNATYIGGGANSAKGSGNDAFRLKENFAGQFHNSVFHDFGGNSVRVASDTEAQVGVNLLFTNNIFGTFATSGTHNGSTVEADLLAQVGNVTSTNPQVGGLVRDNLGNEVVSVDARPYVGSPAWDFKGENLTQGGLMNANFKGAFGYENWTANWSYISQYGVFKPSIQYPAQPITIENITADITTDTTWNSDMDNDGVVDTIYYLNKAIAVKDSSLINAEYTGSKVVLTIEPGTIIASEGSGDAGSGTQVGSLVVTRAGQLEAEGTANQPIIFTSVSAAEARFAVDVNGDTFINDLEPSPITDGGEWGGVILLGNAPINYVAETTNVNQAAIEGFPATTSADILYGGNNVNDDSGALKYVRIEFGGFEFQPDEEINGLTMGGVGSATDISFVEVVGNADDGFEFFGGTVNTSYLISYANQDESFDLDQGHQAVHQFLLAIQSTASDNGTEADGGDGDDSTLEPLTNAKFYNLTYIGGGINSAKTSGNDAFRLKENFAGQFHNSIFHDFGGNAVRVASDTEAQVGVNLFLTNSIFGAFASADTHSGSAAELALLNQLGNTATGTNPQLFAYERVSDEIAAIDPRPAEASPAWNNTVLEGAPTVVNYRGAFGKELWSNTWSYISNYGLVRPSLTSFDEPAATFVVLSGDVEIVTSSFDKAAGTGSITFVTESATSYKITRSELNLTSFADFQVGIAGTGSNITVPVTFTNTAEKVFFRIEEE